MNSIQFVSALVEHVHKAAVSDTMHQLEGPSGRRPPKKVMQAADWYAGLGTQDKAKLASVVELSVHSALFGLLCAIDGVRSIQDNPTHELQLLSFEHGIGTRLNTAAGNSLHDIYQQLVYPHVFE